MILNLSIPDATYIAYGEYGFHRPHQAIEAQVKRWAHVDPSDARALVITGAVRDALEKIFARTIDSPEELVKVAREAAEFKIGEHPVELPEEIQKYLRGQADFAGKPVGEFIRDTTTRLLFANAGRGTY